MRRNGATARVISEFEELVQSVEVLILLVLSLLAVAKSSSFCFEDVGQQSAEAASRWRPLQAIFARTQAPGAGLGLRPHRYLVRACPMPMH